jgi:hypothetical protein
MALGSPTGNDIITAELARQTSNAVIAVTRYSGVDAANPIGAMLSANTNGLNGNCSGGIDNAAYSFSIPATAAGYIYGAVAHRNKKHSSANDFSEIVEIVHGSGGSAAGLTIQDHSSLLPSPVTLAGQFDGAVDWAVVGLEIRPVTTDKSNTVFYSAEVKPDKDRTPGAGFNQGTEIKHDFDNAAASAAMLDVAATNVSTVNVNGFSDDPDAITIPQQPLLFENYPNPFNSETIIEYALPASLPVKLMVYNIIGQQIRKLVNEVRPSGYHRAIWNGKDDRGLDVGSGVYFLQFSAGEQNFVKRMVLQK